MKIRLRIPGAVAAILIAMMTFGGCASVEQSTGPQTTVDVTIVKEPDGWKVVPGVRSITGNTRVQFKIEGEATADVYMLDRGLFEERRLKVAAGQNVFLNVNPRARRGIYPYYVVVKEGTGYHVAEGNSMPVFIME